MILSLRGLIGCGKMNLPRQIIGIILDLLVRIELLSEFSVFTPGLKVARFYVISHVIMSILILETAESSSC
jgi:hypothetical protein